MVQSLYLVILITVFHAGSTWRDADEKSSSEVGHGKLHPHAYNAEPDDVTPNAAPVEDTLQAAADEVSSVEEAVEDELHVSERNFLFFLHDPLGSPFLFGTVSFCFLLCILGLACACCRTYGTDKSEFEDAKRDGPQVSDGTVLICVCKCDEIVEVIAAVGSDETIDKVLMGDKRIATGPVEEFQGKLMVPIQPTGVVDLSHFKDERSLCITAGTVLICEHEEKNYIGAYVYESINSPTAVAKVRNGERVVARRGTQWSCDGRVMVPIRPQGAVELSYFVLKEGVLEDATEAWLKAEREGTNDLDDKLKALRAQKAQVLLEQAARKRKLESIRQAMIDHEASLLGKSGPSDEEVKQKSDKAIKNVNRATQRGILMTVAYAAPLITQSQRIYRSMETKMQMCKDKSQALLLEEVKQFSKEMQSLMGFDDLGEVDLSALNEIDIPTVACIMASAFAPAQLSLLYAINKAFFACSILFVLIDLIVLSFDWRTPCMGKPVAIPPNPTFKQMLNVWWADASDNHIYLWFLADAVVHLLCLLVRLPVILNVKQQLDVLERQNRKPTDIFDQEEFDEDEESSAARDIAIVLKRLLEYYMTTGFATLQQLDRVLRSFWIFLANFSIVFDVLWITYGTYLVWNTPWFECADVGIIILRIRSSLFLALIAVYLLKLTLFCMGQLMQSDNFSVQIIHLGDKIDEAMQLGLPLFKALFHALVVRHSSDMVAIQVNMHRLEKQRLQEKQTKRMAQLHELNKALEASDRVIDGLEYKNAMHSRAFKDHAEIQKEVNRMKAQYKEDSFRFSKRVGDRAVKTAEKAITKIEELQRGEGSFASTQEENVAQDLSASVTGVVDQTQVVTETVPEQNSQPVNLTSSEGALTTVNPPSNADLAAGGSQSVSSAARRVSQPDEGAGR